MTTSQLNPQSASARRAAETRLRELIDRLAPTHQRLVGAIRRSLRTRLPTAHELVYEYRDCVVISVSPSDRGYEGVFAIRASADGVKLYFNRGKGLPDPEKLLKGTAQARWIYLESTSTLARPAVARLIDEAIARNRVPFARTGRGPVTLQSVSAAPRPKPMDNHRVFKMSFASVYPHYVNKAEKKGRTRKEVDQVICWLTGYSPAQLAAQIKQKNDFETFFAEAPSFHPNAGKINGVICGVRIEEIAHPLMRKIRYMDKLVDELAKGRPMEKILRA